MYAVCLTAYIRVRPCEPNSYDAPRNPSDCVSRFEKTVHFPFVPRIGLRVTDGENISYKISCLEWDFVNNRFEVELDSGEYDFSPVSFVSHHDEFLKAGWKETDRKYSKDARPLPGLPEQLP